MYDPKNTYEISLINLIQKWTHLSSQDKISGEFNNLYQETLELILDFRLVIQPDFIENSLKEQFKNTLCSIKFADRDMMESIEELPFIDKWDSPMAMALLAGKIFTRAVKHNMPYEKKLLLEDDNVIMGRINSLMSFFQNNNTPEVSQMILNSLETYKKLIICETDMQNKIGCSTLENLIKALLVITCHRKEYDHLNSMIKVLPHHRKIQFLLNEIDTNVNDSKIQECMFFICAAISGDLLRSEFSQPQEEQDIKKYNLYVNLFIDLALRESFIDRQLEKLFLSANDMNVISNYYYLVANMLRFKMPNQHENLVVKLSIIGLSHDLTYLEKIKYTKVKGELKYSEEDFKVVYRRMYMALTSLGFIVKDYTLRRLCIQAASACEPSTNFCSEIVSFLPECESKISVEDPEMKAILTQLREQLETFQSAIKMKINLPSTWTKTSLLCYERLDFLNRRTILSENLVPLVYPGVEKYLKRNRRDSSDEEEEFVEKKPLDVKKILNDNLKFKADIESRMKKVLNPSIVESNVQHPIPSEVRATIINGLRKCPDFEIIENGEIFAKWSPEMSLESLMGYTHQWKVIHSRQLELNKPNLFFDFNMEEKALGDFDLLSMYQEGVVRVYDLCCNGCNIFDIENVMLYAIMEKKRLYIQQEFIELNKHQVAQATQNYAQHTFNYLMFRTQPESCRMLRTVNLAYTSTSMLDYNIENYTIGAEPGKYKYQKRGRYDDADGNDDDTSMELPQQENTTTKSKPKKSVKMPKDTPPKDSTSISKDTQKSNKPKILKKDMGPPTMLATEETFEASEEILEIFRLLENELSTITKEKVTINLSQLTDATSKYKVGFTYHTSTQLVIRLQKRRNSRPVPVIVIEREFPARIHGIITVNLDFTDKILYDKNNENPFIKSSSQITLSGHITFDHVSVIIKEMDLKCSIGGVQSSVKVSMRVGSRSGAKAAKSDAQQSDSSSRLSIDSNGNASDQMLSTLGSPNTPTNGSANPPLPSFFSPPSSTTSNVVQQQAFKIKEEPMSENYQAPLDSAFTVKDELLTGDYQVPSDSSFTVKDEPMTENFHAPSTIPPFPLQHVNRSPAQPSRVQVVSPMSRELSNTESNLTTYIPSPPVVKSIESFLPSAPFSNQETSPAQVLISSQPQYAQTLSYDQQLVDSNQYQHSTSHESQPTQYQHFSPELQNGSHSVIVSPLTKYDRMKLTQPVNVSNPQQLVSPKKEKITILKQEIVSPKSSLFYSDVSLFIEQQAKLNTIEALPTVQKQDVEQIKDEPSECDEAIDLPAMNHPTAIDFEAEIEPCLVKSLIKPVPIQEPTPPTSPPPLHFHKIKNEIETDDPFNSFQAKPAPPADRNWNNTPPEEVIDLTNEAVDLTIDPMLVIQTTKYKRPSVIQPPPISDFHFVSCDTSDNKPLQMYSSEVKIAPNALNREYSRVMNKVEMKKLGPKFSIQANGSESKRFRISSKEMKHPSQFNLRKSEVRVVNIMHYMKEAIPKAKMIVKANPVTVSLPYNVQPFRTTREDIQITSNELEEPIEDPSDFVADISKSTFHIIYQNFVSYMSGDEPLGDGIANNLLTAKNQCNDIRFKFSLNNANVHEKNCVKASSKFYVDNIANDKLLREFARVNLVKAIDSEKNRLNFTKNLKNQKKFCHWTPKISNDAKVDNKLHDFDDGKKKSGDTNLLYQMSCDVLQSIPGLNSFEFFQFPPTPRRMVHVKVIHVLKDMKNGSSSTSCDTSDTDGEQNSDAHNLQSDISNGEATHASSTHVQKIGQTSINRDGDSKTIQTSFGSIIKNTYPPATLSSRTGNGSSEIVKSLDKDQLKYAKLKNDDAATKKSVNDIKTNSNVKIVACSSSSPQIDPPKVNRNQTLINMLTQQVMLPTNSNRHFIITSNNSVRCENNFTTVSSALPSHQNVVKKVVTTQAQSQLVQILNSPPSNFSMKSMNTSIASSQAKSPNPLVTSTPVTNASFKPELPSAAKQQGIVQFICKTDGKIIHLTPICNNSAGGNSKKITYKVDTSGAKGPTILHHANQQIIINNQMKKSDNQNILTIIQKQDDGDKKNKSAMLNIPQSPGTPTSPISTRSIYEETYAKFIQTSSSSKSSDMGLLTISSSPINTPITSATSSSIIQKIGKTVIQSSSSVLPKFNHAFGKAVFTTTAPTTNEQLKAKILGAKEMLATRQTTVNFADTKPVTKITRTVSEIKSTDAGTLLSLIDNDKPLPTLQSAMHSNLLYARPIGNGKLLASSSNNMLLQALRSNNQTGNVRIITSMSDNTNRSTGTIMAPMRISVPIQIPKLINTSVRQQTPGNFRQQIVIATTPTRTQQTVVSGQSAGSKLESLLMSSQVATVVKQEIDVEQQQKINNEAKQKKNVDHSTLEQLREFDMVLEQVLERSSSEVTATSMSSPPTPETVNHSSPKKQLMPDGSTKTEIKLNAVTITSISPSVSPSLKTISSSSSSSGSTKAAPKMQEDEHTAQRILDILANYKEQVRNSPDLNNKPAPRRRANPPTNPPAAKRKKVVVSGGGSMKSSKQFGSTSDMMTDTMGSEEDSSCGMGSGVASTGSINNSPQPHDIDDQTDGSMDNNFYMEDSKRETALSPQSSSSSVATSPSHNKFSISRRLVLTETKSTPTSEMSQSPNKNIVITNAANVQQSTLTTNVSSIERFTTQGSTAAVLMPGNYLLPMNYLKSGQQLAILSSNNGQKIIAVPTSQLSSVVGNSSGTSIILQRYLNQANESANKTILTQSDGTQNAFKSVRFQPSQSVAYMNNKCGTTQSGNTLYIRPIPSLSNNLSNNLNETKTLLSSHTGVKVENDQTQDSQHSKFVSDKTLITEIIQQQQQMSHTHHPQQNFMIKLNEHQPSDPRSSSSIMFVSNSHPTSSSHTENKDISFDAPKIKIEEMDYEDYMKEDAIDLLHESDSMAKSPMLNTKIEVDDSTNSNQDENIYEDVQVKMEHDQTQKFQQFPIILNSCHGKGSNVNNIIGSTNIKGFLIDPTNKIVMYNDRKPATIEKEFFNQKSFSEECADLGVDEPIASDLFPEADLLFDSGSPKFDQINSHDGAMHIKKELENGQVLLEMNYNHNMETESWLNFDTEEELVDDSQLGDDVKDNDDGGGSSGDLKAYF